MSTQGLSKTLTSNCLFTLVVILASIGSNAVHSQTPSEDQLLSHVQKLDVESGILSHDGEEAKLIWEEIIEIDDAQWLRLKFDELDLGTNPLNGTSSTLRITSLQDGSFQLLNAKTAVEWRNTSAYFNGNAVRLELLAAPNGLTNSIKLAEATVGEPSRPDVTATICDDVDDRILFDDPRVGRTAPGGCTGWLFNNRNNCMLTAGHCAPSNEVMLFNVPISDANGNRQFPGPEDQYAVDFSSVQARADGVGADWCYFGCFPNSTTGLTAFEAQGDSFELVEPSPVQAGDMIRITGFGSTSFPVSPTFNGASKTQVGPYAIQNVNRLGYRTDTTGGNSGSPVIFEATGEAIGIHTHGGCGSGGSGENNGTASTHFGLANAIENPQGTCLVTLEFNFPDGQPDFVEATGGDLINVEIDGQDFDLAPSTATFHFDSGSGFQQSSMEFLGGSTYRAEVPAAACGTIVSYFFSIETTDGETFTNPNNAPTGSYSVISSVGGGLETFADNFQTDLGWTVTGNAGDGQWERAVPQGGGDRGDPAADADGSGVCFVTDNEDDNSDVDDGTTQLLSPIFDATADEASSISYSRWFDNGGEGDLFLIEISNNAGATWTTLEAISTAGVDTSGGWISKDFLVADFVPPTSQMQLRFSVSDTNDPSIVEAGVDAFAVRVHSCVDNEVLLGDVDQNGTVNLLDIGPFVDLLSNGLYQEEADMNSDGVVNLSDVGLFVAAISG